MRVFATALVAALALTACSGPVDEDIYPKADRFELISREEISRFNTLYIFRDKETGCEYVTSSEESIEPLRSSGGIKGCESKDVIQNDWEM